MQIVEPGPWPLAAADLRHRRLVARPPLVGEGVPTLVVALWPESGLGLARDAVAPVHHRAEHVKSQGLYIRKRHRPTFPIACSRSRRVWPSRGASSTIVIVGRA